MPTLPWARRPWIYGPSGEASYCWNCWRKNPEPEEITTVTAYGGDATQPLSSRTPSGQTRPPQRACLEAGLSSTSCPQLIPRYLDRAVSNCWRGCHVLIQVSPGKTSSRRSAKGSCSDAPPPDPRVQICIAIMNWFNAAEIKAAAKSGGKRGDLQPAMDQRNSALRCWGENLSNRYFRPLREAPVRPARSAASPRESSRSLRRSRSG